MSTTALTTASRLAPRSTTKARLLLVEDDPFCAALLSRWLMQDSSLEIVTASEGQAALHLLDAEPFDVILADINLPGASGLEIIQRSKAIAPGRATILMTAEETVEHALAALRLHVDDLLFKPIARDPVLKTVGKAIARAQAVRLVQPRTVLAVGAHPDDVEIGCGAALLAHRQAGDQVVILTLSQGRQGGVGATRKAESEQAARAMDAELLMADLEDTHISEGPETIAVISQAIATYAPQQVYTHTAADVHQDHRAVHRASLVAARAVPSVFCYQSPSSTVDFHPTYFVDVSAFVDRKIEVLSLYQTQAGRRYLMPDLVRATARYWGRYGDCSGVEPFEVIRARS